MGENQAFRGGGPRVCSSNGACRRRDRKQSREPESSRSGTGVMIGAVAMRTCCLLLTVFGWSREAPHRATADRPKTGYVLHFDAVSDVAEVRRLVPIGVEAGAQVISVVPPARVWEDPRALEMLDAVVDEI